jgi:cold shock CspA family protein
MSAAQPPVADTTAVAGLLATAVHPATVIAFDDARGLGAVRTDEGYELFLHCTALADGTRTVAVGAQVACTVVAGRLGAPEVGVAVVLDNRAVDTQG